MRDKSRGLGSKLNNTLCSGRVWCHPEKVGVFERGFRNAAACRQAGQAGISEFENKDTIEAECIAISQSQYRDLIQWAFSNHARKTDNPLSELVLPEVRTSKNFTMGVYY